MPKCPHCSTPGQRNVTTAGLVPCHTCGGTNEITSERFEAMRRGNLLRARRVGAGIALRVAAADLGISARELCDVENGRVEGNEEVVERLWVGVENV